MGLRNHWCHRVLCMGCAVDDDPRARRVPPRRAVRQRPCPYDEGVTADIIATIATAVLIVIGCVGIVVPVLPGSITALIGLIIWAFVVRAPEGWVVLALGGTLLLAGISASLVLTGSKLKRRAIPNRTLLFGVVGAVIGMFVIPVVGLFIGFVVGLLLSETVRNKDFNTALSTSWVAAKAMGVGILVELLCALLASLTFIIGAIVYFVTVN